MKILKVIVAIIVILAAVWFIGGMFLPKTYSISRTILINAPDSTVYMNVADFNNFLKWNPWSKMEPTAKTSITGEPGQTGHRWEWAGTEIGTGEMVIREANPYSAVNLDLNFKEPFPSSADTRFSFENTDSGTKVVWSMTGEGKTTLEKWMGLGMDSMMDGDFTSGLAALKELSEQ